VASSLIARPRGTTDKRRTTTTNSSSSHHHDSAPSRPHPLIYTGAEPIHPVHGPPKLPAVAPRNEVIFLPFWRGFIYACVCVYVHVYIYTITFRPPETRSFFSFRPPETRSFFYHFGGVLHMPLLSFYLIFFFPLL